jgi:hypothetical protein
MFDDNSIQKLALLKRNVYTSMRWKTNNRGGWMKQMIIVGCLVWEDGDEWRWTGGKGKETWKWPGPKLGCRAVMQAKKGKYREKQGM